jgi:hypothetical protein
MPKKRAIPGKRADKQQLDPEEKLAAHAAELDQPREFVDTTA